MTLGKKSLHLFNHFGKKTIFMQATNTYTIKTNIQGDPKKRAPTLIRPRFLVFCPNKMKLWS